MIHSNILLKVKGIQNLSRKMFFGTSEQLLPILRDFAHFAYTYNDRSKFGKKDYLNLSFYYFTYGNMSIFREL